MFLLQKKVLRERDQRSDPFDFVRRQRRRSERKRTATKGLSGRTLGGGLDDEADHRRKFGSRWLKYPYNIHIIVLSLGGGRDFPEYRIT